MNKFKIGDKVLLIKNLNLFVLCGEIGTITEVPSSHWHFYSVRFCDTECVYDGNLYLLDENYLSLEYVDFQEKINGRLGEK